MTPTNLPTTPTDIDPDHPGSRQAEGGPAAVADHSDGAGPRGTLHAHHLLEMEALLVEQAQQLGCLVFGHL